MALYGRHLFPSFSSSEVSIPSECITLIILGSFVYGILYLELASIPIAFGEVRHWGPVTQQLPLLALLFGIILGGGANILVHLSFFIIYLPCALEPSVHPNPFLQTREISPRLTSISA